MTQTSYTVVPQDDGSFKVEVVESDRTFMPDQTFADEAAAKAWIAEQLTMEQAEKKFDAAAPRNWREK